MLPDFRFLFATVVLAVSVLIFGLGAAALLRAAHEEFVSLPSWRLAQQPLLAPQFEMNAPTLAMLRIEAPAPRSMVESTRPHVMQADAPRLEAVHPEPVRDLPPVQPEAVAVPAAITMPVNKADMQTEPPVSVAEPSAPAAETVADTPASENMSDAHATEAATPETQEPEAKPAIQTSTENEASEPPETVGAITRSSEATATAVVPLPVARKPVRVNTRAAVQRRRAIARARAATRAAQQQQQRQAPDPFGLFGTPAPTPRS